MSGGVVVISEDMPSLDLNNFALLKKILPTSQLVCGQPFKCVCYIDFQSYTSAVGATHVSAVHCLPLLIGGFNITLNSKIDLEDELRYISSTACENFEDGVSEGLETYFQDFCTDFWKERPLRRDLMLHEASQYQGIDSNTV